MREIRARKLMVASGLAAAAIQTAGVAEAAMTTNRLALNGPRADRGTPKFPDPYSCRSFDEGFYGECHAEAGDGHWPSLRTCREVITVYVSN